MNKTTYLAAVLVAGVSLSSTNLTSTVYAERADPLNHLNVRIPALKDLERYATKSGDTLKKNKDKFASQAANFKERFATRAADLENKFSSLSGKLKENRNQRLNKLTENVTRRFLNITERQENILKRTDIRIASLSSEGKNTSELTIKSASISAQIVKQRASINALKVTLTSIAKLNSSAGEKVGTAISDVVKQVTATHKALQELVHLVAKLSPTNHPRPTHSPSPGATANI